MACGCLPNPAAFVVPIEPASRLWATVVVGSTVYVVGLATEIRAKREAAQHSLEANFAEAKDR